MTEQTRWFIAGILIVLALILTARACRADDLDVRAAMARVNEILHTDVRELPAVYIVDRLPRRAWGAYAENEIRISAEAPEACRGLILGHEVSHAVAIKAGLLAKIPSDIDALKAELERLAMRVEAAWPEYLPGCMARAD